MVRGGALHSRPPGRLPKRPRPQVHEKGLVPRRKGFCIKASISAGPVELQLGSSQARSGFLRPMRSVLSVHRMHVRTRGRPPHAHTCGAAFGMRGVSGMPRVWCERPRNGLGNLCWLCSGESEKRGWTCIRGVRKKTYPLRRKVQERTRHSDRIGGPLFGLDLERNRPPPGSRSTAHRALPRSRSGWRRAAGL